MPHHRLSAVSARGGAGARRDADPGSPPPRADATRAPGHAFARRAALRAALGGIAALPAAAAGSQSAVAPEFPRQPVRLVVPFAPGGATDVVARILAPGMQQAFGGRPVVVENRGGAGGLIGAEAVATAPPDGHTVILLTITNAVLMVGLMRNARVDPRRDFEPVSLVATLPMVLTVGRHVPARDLPELIALLRSRPGRLTYGSAGPGSINHLGAHLLTLRTGTQAEHVPYRGAGPVFADMIAGNVDMLIEGIPSQAPHVRSGQIRAIAVLAPERSPLLPEVPTAIEQGIAGFQIMNFMGVYAPAGTPPAVIARLEQAVRSAVRDETVAQRLRDAGTEPAGSAAAEFRSFWQAQLDLWLPVVEASGIRLD
ncbi:Bug family tripartite tricarboxylate transporter substrate binding protein [Caldovatus aquaticus]|uniref:Tripartite tricarboxylate transporter substrate binding protein n=1 Tax=Caldovatus aquaticus TaxID=2865671 RepID=A0ABS7F0A0_9PROT|nr:tripartite tricarboxylate transporter substrate binding protein [Caldovatus aquaticus]MBW8268221.1 tripartite tricarboxylate transporter substrate binding protein [Caldovatus aquaticus]